jgi:O-antigen ligase
VKDRFLSTLISSCLLLLPTLSYVSFGGLILFILIIAVTQPKRFGALAVQWGWLWLGLGLWINSQLAHDPVAAHLQLANFLPFMAVTVALGTWLPQVANPHREAETWAGWLLVITIPVNVLAAVEYWLMTPGAMAQLSGVWGLQWFYGKNANFGPRADLLFGHPNTLACYFVFVFALGLGLMVRHCRATQSAGSALPVQVPSPRVIRWLTESQWRLPGVTLLNLVGLFSTGSRNGVIVAIATLGLALVTSPGQWRLKCLIGGGLSLLVTCAGIFGIGGRSFSWEMFSQDPRLDVWRIAWSHAINHPWWGIGLGNYGVLYEPQSVPGYDAMPHAHGLWFMLLAETGFPLTFLMTGIVGWTLYRAVRKLKTLERSKRSVVMGYLWAFSSLTIFSLFDLTIAYPRTTFLGWLALGVIYGTTQTHLTQDSDQLRSAQTKI